MRAALLSRLATLHPAVRCIGVAALITVFVFAMPWLAIGLWVSEAVGWLVYTVAQWCSAHVRLVLAVSVFITLSLVCLWVSEAWGADTPRQRITEMVLLTWLLLAGSSGLAYVGDNGHPERAEPATEALRSPWP